jgi:hypothetical protein
MEPIISFLTGGAIGAFLGGFAKFFWERWLPDRMTWRRENAVEREKLLSQFRGPATRAVSELQGRIYVIVRRRGANYQYTKGTKQKLYYVDSTTFLVAQCYAWMEILRDKMATFDYADLFTQLDEVTAGFSGGRPGFQVFWLEQREIGERMLKITDEGEMRCVGYSEFLDMLQSSNVLPCFVLLREKVEAMLEGWSEEIVRLARIQKALVKTVNFIDPDSRWMPMNKREILNVAEELDEMVKDKQITRAAADKLIKAVDE